jgi:hypothetical protein
MMLHGLPAAPEGEVIFDNSKAQRSGGVADA